MPTKDFDAALREKRGEELEFVVAGQTFTARAKLPWKKYSTLIMSLFGQDVTTADGLNKTEEFFRLVIVKRDRDRFIALMDSDGDGEEDGEGDEDNVIDPTQVSALLDWMLALYTGKEPKNETSSSDSPPTTGLPSNVISLDGKSA